MMVTVLAAFSVAALPLLAQPIKVECSGAPITVQIGHLAPNFVDWDKDGKKDLLVGTFLGAELRVYRNVGSKKSPMFKDYTLAQAQGKNMAGEAG